MSRYSTTTHKNTKEEPLHICILCGSVGYREKGNGPKVLKTLGECSIFEHQLNTIRHVYPNAKVSITSGFQADKIIRLRPEGVSIIENQLWEEYNTTEEIRLLLNSIEPYRLLLIDGAVFFDPESIKDLTNTTSVFLYDNKDEQDIGVQIDEGEIVRFSYGLNKKWGGLVYLEDIALSTLKKIANRENSKYCLHELLNIMITKGIQFKQVESVRSKLIKF